MKSIKNFFETLFVLFLFMALFAKEKTSRRTWLIWGTVGIFCCWQLGEMVYDAKYPYQDCVPATLQRIFPQYTLKQMRYLCQTERDGTYVTNLVRAMYTISTNDLEIIYNKQDVIDGTTNNTSFLVYKPYLWVGTFTNGAGHCALIKFYPTNAVLSNSQFVQGTTNYYLTSLSYDEFFEVTDVVFDSKDIKDDIRFR